MSKKRFKVWCDSNLEWIMQDTLLLPIKEKDQDKRLSIKQTCDLLNDLSNENDVLKQQVKTRYIVNKQYEELMRLKDENQELKKENTHLKNELSWIKDYAYWKEKDAFNKLFGYYMITCDEFRIMAKENEQLKQEIKEQKIQLNFITDQKNNFYRKLLERNNSIGLLKKENEQLKETINELQDMDKEKDIEIEHINNIYKEFGFKGIIDYAKDKLQDYGAVREVDNGLWLLATGGWSDNEFWLDCLLDWNFMYAKGHYRATTSGGGYYYTETPYEDIEIKKRQIKG